MAEGCRHRQVAVSGKRWCLDSGAASGVVLTLSLQTSGSVSSGVRGGYQYLLGYDALKSAFALPASGVRVWCSSKNRSRRMVTGRPWARGAGRTL